MVAFYSAEKNYQFWCIPKNEKKMAFLFCQGFIFDFLKKSSGKNVFSVNEEMFMLDNW